MEPMRDAHVYDHHRACLYVCVCVWIFSRATQNTHMQTRAVIVVWEYEHIYV